MSRDPLAEAVAIGFLSALWDAFASQAFLFTGLAVFAALVTACSLAWFERRWLQAGGWGTAAGVCFLILPALRL